MSFVKELKRRNVFRMAVLYAVAAWVIVQVAEVLIDLAKLPDWIGTTTLWLLAVGFPIALIFSWFYELTSEGISLEKDVDPQESISHVTGRRIDFIVISMLCAAVILFAYDKWWMSGPPEQSIAVLPFVNMSDDASNEYFSDGISEELLNLLARIPELRVVSRTSSFFYKDKKINLVDVARDLNVAHILEGSVRKAGNQVRITVQLIEARSDTHLWSETYDRTLDDIFSVQDEIAAVVVERLKVTLLGVSPKVEETDPEAYALYLQAHHLANIATAENLQRATILYKEALAIDPKYVPALLGLGKVYGRLAGVRVLTTEEARALALEAIERAINIDPNSAEAQSHLGWDFFKHSGDLEAAAHHFDRALTLEPTNTNIIGNVSIFLTALGRLKEAIILAEYQVSRDPANARAYNNLGIRYRFAGQFEQAKKAFSTALTFNPLHFGVEYELGATLLLEGDYAAAANAFERESHVVFKQIGMAMTYHAQGESALSHELLKELISSYGERITFYIAQIMAFRGEIDGAFEWLEKANLANDYELSNVINEPLLSNLYADPRWLPFLENIGKSPKQLAAIEFNVTLPE
jgi:TolB-like protein/Flp pilus assembly protein TadD